MTTKATIEPCFKNSGYRYRVIHEGAILIEDTSNPEYDACKALLAKGFTGCLETYRGNTPCMRLDIKKGAKLTIEETPTQGPRKVKYRPWNGAQNRDSRVAVGGNFAREGPEGANTPTPILAAPA
jgi:hypothetical protein